jgi:hypothetical protein
MRPAVDNRPPASYPHLTSLGRDYFAKKKATTEAAFADLKMIGAIAKTMTRPSEHADTRGGQNRTRSLTADIRKKELYRITMANHALLERLENLKPVYKVREQIREYKGTREFVANASHTARKAGLYDDLLVAKAKRTRQIRSLPKVQSLPAITESGSVLQAQAELESSKAASYSAKPAQLEGSRGKPHGKSSPKPLVQSSLAHAQDGSSDSMSPPFLALEPEERDAMPSPMLAVADAELEVTSDPPVKESGTKVGDALDGTSVTKDSTADHEQVVDVSGGEPAPERSAVDLQATETAAEPAEAKNAADADVQEVQSPSKSAAGESYADDFDGDGMDESASGEIEDEEE